MADKILYITIYKDEDQVWRWVVKDKYNRAIVGESHKGFDKMTDAKHNLEKLTGMYAPAINNGQTKVTTRVYAGYRKHKHIELPQTLK